MQEGYSWLALRRYLRTVFAERVAALLQARPRLNADYQLPDMSSWASAAVMSYPHVYDLAGHGPVYFRHRLSRELQMILGR